MRCGERVERLWKGWISYVGCFRLLSFLNVRGVLRGDRLSLSCRCVFAAGNHGRNQRFGSVLAVEGLAPPRTPRTPRTPRKRQRKAVACFGERIEMLWSVVDPCFGCSCLLFFLCALGVLCGDFLSLSCRCVSLLEAMLGTIGPVQF